IYLIITYTTAYIKIKVPLITILGYLKLFRKSKVNWVYFLGKKSIKDLYRDYSI
ncbi:hypothetical protein V2W45_1229637, partial [Cenococcum geophilum]